MFTRDRLGIWKDGIHYERGGFGILAYELSVLGSWLLMSLSPATLHVEDLDIRPTELERRLYTGDLLGGLACSRWEDKLVP